MSVTAVPTLTQSIERRIISRLVGDALAAGYTLNVHNGGDTNELPEYTADRKLIIDTLFATYDEHLLYAKDGKRAGWVLLIHGNGRDVISDYNTGIESVVSGAEALADTL